MNLARIAYGLVAVIGSVVVLRTAKDILIPFFLAIMLWFILKEVTNFVGRLRMKGRALPGWFNRLVSMLLIFAVLGFVVQLLSSNMQGMAANLPKYSKNVKSITAKITKDVQHRFPSFDLKMLKKKVSSFDFSSLVKSILNSISGLLSNGFLVILYVLFLILEEKFFSQKIVALYPKAEDHAKANQILNKINDSLGQYITLKTAVSLITGVLSYIALKMIGVDFPVFWAVLIFLLNYIPTIGSMIATLFPVVFALLQFGTYGPALTVLVFVGSIQVLVGNILEPKWMGNSLNVSSLVVLLALAFWGWLWGVTGMILCVPITVMAVIVCAQFPQSRSIAVLLSEQGNVDASQSA